MHRRAPSADAGTDVGQSSYEELPYPNRAYAETHPDHLATLGRLFGLTPPPVEQCRALELGCAAGGNLIPMALTLPGSHFVGVDLSGRQIAEGRATVAALGLSNVVLKASSLADISSSIGRFDYIIAHGVYSWVEEALREKILAICSENLSPDGIALVSYNTYPGWRARSMVREMMAYHVRRELDPAVRAKQARHFLEELARWIPNPGDPHAHQIRNELEYVRSTTDAHVLHDHLEVVNEPVYYHQFVTRAMAHGLCCFGDAQFGSMAICQPPPLQAVLDRWSSEPLEREQYLDFLCNRQFRSSLLCLDRLSPARAPSPDVVASLRASLGRTRPAQTPHGTATAPIAAELVATWPNSVDFETLLARIARRSDPLPEEGRNFNSERTTLAALLLRGFAQGWCVLHTLDSPLPSKTGTSPLASPLARHQAATAPEVTNLRHWNVELSGFDRLVLRHLDGQRDRKALVDALTEEVVADRFAIQQDGRPVREPHAVRAIIERSLEPSLQRLGASALLMA
jgi:SAM-dependent methyltransferase